MHRRPHILIVDDDRWVLEGYRQILGGRGLRVETASGAGEAIRRIEENGHRLDAAVVDVNLVSSRDQLGFEIVRTLRKSRPELPVLMVSAWDEASLREQALEEGASRFLEKPLTAARLYEELHNIGIDGNDGNGHHGGNGHGRRNGGDGTGEG